MFKFNDKASYVMPAHFGPRPMSPKASGGGYRDVTSMMVSYRTDREALARYLPAPFEVDEEAVVSVFYARNREVDWLAGHGYNMIAVNASAVFSGENDRLKGQYTLVLWENLTDPILTGRELQGIPRLYAAPRFREPAFPTAEQISAVASDALVSTLVRSALALAEKEVATRSNIDLAWKTASGLASGPFEILQEMGLGAFCEILDRQVEAGLLS